METPQIIAGRAFPPHRSLALEAELRLEADLVRLVAPDGTELSRCARAELRFEAPLGRAPRRARLPDGSLFETADHAAVRALDPAAAGEHLHRLEAFHPRLVGVVLAAVAAVWLIWRYGLDVLAAAAVAMTPPPVVGAIDAGFLHSLDLSIAEPSQLDPDRQAALREIMARLTARLDPGDGEGFDFRLEFRAMPGRDPNAFALPHGTIVITDAFAELFDDPDIQAGVIGHEIGHVVENHGLRQLYRSLGAAVLIALLAGDTGEIVQDVVLEGNLLVSLSFSRAHERAADDFGVALTRRAGFDPEGLVAFFDYVIAEYGDDSSWLSTHPSSAERIERIRQAARGGG